MADLSKAEAKTPSEAKALAEAIEVTRTRRDTMARMLEEHRANPHELYMRLAGEIEARNVQARMNMTAEERAKKPFNETLEYRGEAITPITFSLNGKEYFSGKDTSINSTKAPAVFAAVEKKLGGNKKRGGRRWFHFPPVSDSRSLTLSPHGYSNTFRTLYQAK